MTIVDITDENVEEYRDMISPEYLADIGREYSHGLIGVLAEGEPPCAAIFWEVKNAEREKLDNVAEVHMFTARSEEEGSELLDAFAKRCGYDEVRTSFFEIGELQEHELAALKNQGFEIKQTEGMDVFVTVKELAGLAIAKKAPPDYVKKIGDLSFFQMKAGIMNSVFHGRYGLLDDLPFLPMSWYEQDLSSCVLSDDVVVGILLVHNIKPRLYRVELLFSEKLDAPTNVLNMVRFSIREAARCCDPEDQVLIRKHNRTVADLVKKLFPGKKGPKIFLGKLSFS